MKAQDKFRFSQDESLNTATIWKQYCEFVANIMMLYHYSFCINQQVRFMTKNLPSRLKDLIFGKATIKSSTSSCLLKHYSILLYRTVVP